MARFAILAAFIFASTAALADGVVSSVVKAPITPDGDVAGAPTDLVINLDTLLDPAFLGRPLPEGCSVAVTLSDAFEWTGLPVQDLFTDDTNDCFPGNFDCTTGVFLQGWPQHPILPHFPPVPGPATQYDLTQGGNENTLVFTALTDLVVPNPRPAPGPGLKQIHLINGFTNPTRPGLYPVSVEFAGGGGCPAESGVADVHIVPKTRPSVEVTSVPAGGLNTIYQVTTVGSDAPLAWDLLLWDRNGGAMVGVTVETVSSDFALLKQGNKAIGNIRIHAPGGALGHMVVDEQPSVEGPAPIKNVLAGLLTVQFTAGSEPGRYTTAVTVFGGRALYMFVDVP